MVMLRKMRRSFVEGAAEGAGIAGGVADEEELAVAGGHYGVDGFVNGFGDAFGFVDDDEHVWGVEALELVGFVGGEAEGEAVACDLEAGVEHGPAEALGGCAVESADFAPEDVADLARGGGGGDDDGWGVAGEEPEDGDGGGEAFAEAVAGFDGDAAVLGEGMEDFFLLAPELDAEDVAGEFAGERRQRSMRRSFSSQERAERVPAFAGTTESSGVFFSMMLEGEMFTNIGATFRRCR